MTVSVEDFRRQARAWLEDNAELLPTEPVELRWGEGHDSLALFRALPHDDERALIDAAMAWQHAKSEAGFGSIDWDEADGGRGLTKAHADAFRAEERAFRTPPGHEAIAITLELIAPTIRAHGTAEQRARFVPEMRRGLAVWCQMFSEPGAGSDLAGVRTRAVRDGDEWVLDGQKVWTSGAQFASWGYIVCRTDPHVPKHRGLTTFLVPMDAPGIEVRPLRQMSGGSSFNEVFLSGVRVPDSLRLGDVGAGWRTVLTTLGFERNASTGGRSDGRLSRLLALAKHLGRNHDPGVRQRLAAVYTEQRIIEWNNARVAARRKAGETPGPESSVGKLAWTKGLEHLGEAAAQVLGPRLAADTGEWGTYSWTEHVLGTAGYRVAGGTDEVQRNIIAERALGLPGDVRVDRDIPFSEIRQ